MLRRLSGGCCGFLVLVVVGGIFSALGGFMFFIAAPNDLAEARRLDELPNQYRLTETGMEVIVSGILSDNPTIIESSPLEITGHEVVAYQLDRWTVRRDSEGDDVGSWNLQRQNIPTFTLLEGYEIPLRVSAEDYPVKLDGDLYKFVQESSSGRRARSSSEGRNLHDGSYRLLALKNGDFVTIYGRNMGDHRLNAEHIYLGDKATFIKFLEDEAQGLRLGGMIFGGVGALVLVIGLGVGLFTVIRR